MKTRTALVLVGLVLLFAACRQATIDQPQVTNATASRAFDPTPPISKAVGTTPQDPVYIENPITIKYGEAFAPLPLITGGSGTGNYQFVIGGYTNWPGHEGIEEGGQGTLLAPENVLSDTWTPPLMSSYPATFPYWARRAGDADYADSILDPNDLIGYTLTVNKQDQPEFGSGDQTVAVGTPFTPAYNGVVGTGASQFVVAGYTNWPGTYGDDSFPGQPGTLLGPPEGPWSVSESWTPTEADTYEFYVRNLGDTTTDPAGPAGPYDLTAEGAQQELVTIEPLNSTIAPGDGVVFTAAGGSGTISYLWGGEATGGSGPEVGVIFDTVGVFEVTVMNPANGSYPDSNTATASITVQEASTIQYFEYDANNQLITSPERSYTPDESGNIQ